MKDSLIIANLPEIKQIQKRKIKPLAQKLASETENPVEAYVILKRLLEFCSEGIKALSPAVLDNMEEGFTKALGMELKAQARGKMTFNHSDAWNDLNNQLSIETEKAKGITDPIKGKLKNLENLMQKKMETPTKEILTEDGELVEPAEIVENPSFSIVAKY